MSWLPEQTASRLDDIAAEMRALVAESTRIWRNAGPAERAILEAHPTWASSDQASEAFAAASADCAKQIWAAIEAKQPEAA